MIESIVVEMKRTGRQRLILVAGADAVGSEENNDVLARRRGEVVKAALMPHGFVVELLSVGESLAPDGTPDRERQQFREVRAYSTEPGSTARM